MKKFHDPAEIVRIARRFADEVDMFCEVDG